MKERPKWCSHNNCIFKRAYQDCMCIGGLPKKVKHNKDYNTHRWCLKNVLPNREIFDLQINKTDIYWFTLLFKAIRED